MKGWCVSLHNIHEKCETILNEGVVCELSLHSNEKCETILNKRVVCEFTLHNNEKCETILNEGWCVTLHYITM